MNLMEVIKVEEVLGMSDEVGEIGLTPLVYADEAPDPPPQEELRRASGVRQISII